jgi:hypothetical protein
MHDSSKTFFNRFEHSSSNFNDLLRVSFLFFLASVARFLWGILVVSFEQHGGRRRFFFRVEGSKLEIET